MMDYGIDYDPPDGLAQALMDGRVDEVTRILQEAGDNFPVLAYIYGKGVKDSQVFGDPTALTLATEYGHVKCVRKILLELGHVYYAFGVELDEDHRESAVIPDDYFGALIIAFSKGHSEICQLLVEFRLFEVPGITDSYAELITAVKQRDFLMLESLLDEVEEKEIFLKGWRGHNIMNLCLFYGCPCSCLKKMMDLGIGVNGWDYNGLTPLMCAIIGKNLTCVQFLLDKGAEPYSLHLKQCKLFLVDGTMLYKESEPSPRTPPFRDYQQRFGPSSLMYAAAMGNIPILKLMLKAAPKDVGIPGRLRQFENDGPLMFAIAYATFESVSLILEFKAARNNVGDRPIVLAMERNDMEMFDLLLEKIPVSTWKPDVIGRTLRECVHHSSQYLAKLCEWIGGGDNFFDLYGGDCLFGAIEYGRLDLVKVLVKLPGFNIDTRYAMVRPSFHASSCFTYACSRRKIDLAKFFLEMGADVNSLDEYQRTPVANAVLKKDVVFLKFLIKVNADLDIEDPAGGTVFSSALMGDGVCLEILLQTKKLFEGDGKKLRPVHRQSIQVFRKSRYQSINGQPKTVTFKAALVLIKHKLFKWDWCGDVDVLSLWSILFGVVSSGLSPGIIMGRYHMILSPLKFALHSANENLFRYLVANLYFFPCDYQYLLKVDDKSFRFLLKQLTSQPLSLQAWSVLYISQSLVNSSDDSFPYDRSSKVDTLPLPTCLKNMLKFKTEFSNLCITHWQYLGPQRTCSEDGSEEVDTRQFDEIVMDGVRVESFTLEKCMVKKCICQGVGQRIKPVSKSVLRERKV